MRDVGGGEVGEDQGGEFRGESGEWIHGARRRRFTVLGVLGAEDHFFPITLVEDVVENMCQIEDVDGVSGEVLNEVRLLEASSRMREASPLFLVCDSKSASGIF